MILRTVDQVRRVFLMIAGFTLLLAGGVMLVTPGPGVLVILLGLGLLAAECFRAPLDGAHQARRRTFERRRPALSKRVAAHGSEFVSFRLRSRSANDSAR